jgi:hypothetical protein
MNISLNVEKVTIDSAGSRYVSVDIEGVDKEDLLGEVSIEDCISYFGADKFLTEIGEDACKELFGLVDPIFE